jgi:drug/metabolite transporter (DMT)-like permease
LVLTGGQIPDELSRANVGDLILLASTILLGGRMIFTARLVNNIEPARVVLWQMLLSLAGFALGALLWEEIVWREVGWIPVGALVYQGVVIAGLAFMVNAG